MVLKASPAYTLIEIMIVLVIIGLFTSIGYANFRGYARRQQAINLARQVEADLRYTQELSLSGPKPAGYCANDGDQLDGYGFKYDDSDSSNKKYLIFARCLRANGSYHDNDTNPTKSVVLPRNIYLTVSPKTFYFLTVGRGTSLSGDTTLSICFTDNEDSGLLISKQGKIQSATPSCP